jgi:hypothetical protein
LLDRELEPDADQRAGVEDASQHARERRLGGQEDCD